MIVKFLILLYYFGFVFSMPTNLNTMSMETIDKVGMSIVNITFRNCAKVRQKTFKTYTDKAYEANRLLPTIFFKLFGYGGSVIDIPITNSSTAIWNSALFDQTLPVFIYSHGMLASADDSDNKEIAITVRGFGGRNALLLDYRQLANNFYFTLMSNVQYVAEALANVLVELRTLGVTDFYLAGHSLGAHVSGIAGKRFKTITGVNIQRITGLDPAGPCYTEEPTSGRLAHTDADFVDVIHTNAYITGIPILIGKVDFFPNGGTDQPGTKSISENHRRAHRYFLESVVNDNFLAESCPFYMYFLSGYCSTNNRIKMGYSTPTDSIGGRYFLKTAASFPYSLGVAGVI